MIITETITITRANTSIEWPENLFANIPEDPNKPVCVERPLITTDISDDLLTKRTTKIWTLKSDFIAVHSYVNPNVDTSAYFDSITRSGISHTRTITTE